MRAIFAVVALAGLTAGGQAAPRCAGAVEIAHAPIVRVERNAALILKDGRAALPEGLRLPGGEADHAPDEIAQQAMAMLKKLTVGKKLDLHAVWPKEDRYDRVRAQLFDSDGHWLQMEMLRQGLARVQLSPDRGECYRQLYEAETEARNRGVGLWAWPAYAIRTAGHIDLAADLGTFQIVYGWVKTAVIKKGRAYINFGHDWKTDFTVTIAPEDMKTFRRLKVDPRKYAGRLIRVRGIIQSYNGPMIEIGNPKQIELLE